MAKKPTARQARLLPRDGKPSDEKTDEGENKESQSHEDEVDLNPSGEVTVVSKEFPPTPPATKRIHPRRVLPPVPEAPTE